MDEMFRDRRHAGRLLAERLTEYRDIPQVKVYGIPMGGVPVAYEVSSALHASLNLVIPRKLPIPWSPEAGFGAVAPDGSLVLNEGMLKELDMSDDQIEVVADMVRMEITRRAKAFGVSLLPNDLKGKTAIVVDDGLASGYTMLAAVQSIRNANAKEIIAAVPVASASAAALVSGSVDRFEALIVSRQIPFAVADFYAIWHDVTDKEVKELLLQK